MFSDWLPPPFQYPLSVQDLPSCTDIQVPLARVHRWSVSPVGSCAASVAPSCFVRVPPPASEQDTATFFHSSRKHLLSAYSVSGPSSSPGLTCSPPLLPRLRGRSGRSKSADLQSGARSERAEGYLQQSEATGVGRGWSDACGSECSGTAEKTLRQAPQPPSALALRWISHS